ncbi:MAG TPA: hypothetical protein RMH99_07975 [Sandaracinaceae bacterium LLY-WYZ-13_1]|nr:hypothetical protein [Sandaracinaceae bacterium LLY-WYZ-13_1]
MRRPLEIRDVLVVHDDDRWCRTVRRRLLARDVEVYGVSTVRGLATALAGDRFDAALFDVRALPAPQWYQAVEPLTKASPAPVVVAWGDELTAFDGFHLGRLGVRKLLPRRPTPDQAWQVLCDAVAFRPPFEPHVRAMVGHERVGDVVDEVRGLFLDQGLGLNRDDRSKTARTLGVSRQAVQQMIRRRKASGTVRKVAEKKPKKARAKPKKTSSG